MEDNQPATQAALKKLAIQIQAIQGLGFEITYRHLPNSQQELRFTRQETGAYRGVTLVVTRPCWLLRKCTIPPASRFTSRK